MQSLAIGDVSDAGATIAQLQTKVAALEAKVAALESAGKPTIAIVTRSNSEAVPNAKVSCRAGEAVFGCVNEQAIGSGSGTKTATVNGQECTCTTKRTLIGTIMNDVAIGVRKCKITCFQIK